MRHDRQIHNVVMSYKIQKVWYAYILHQRKWEGLSKTSAVHGK